MGILVDLLFLAFVGFYGFRGFHRGVIREGFDLLGFTLGLALAVKLYPVPGAVFGFFGVSEGWANFAGGALVFIGIVVLAGHLANRVHRRERFAGDPTRRLRVGGAVFAAAWSALFAIFMMVIFTVIPAPGAQRAIRDSFIGGTVLAGNSPLYPVLQRYAERDARNILFYLRQYYVQLRPEPEQPEGEFFRIEASDEIDADPAAEEALLDLINEERRRQGLGELSFHDEVREVARGHSSDMYRRGYFSHTDPDGDGPFDRLGHAEIDFTFAGENLALAPTVEMVHRGLMNSPEHKDNILKPEFTDLGIGVYKGPYGLMVTENFCAGCSD